MVNCELIHIHFSLARRFDSFLSGLVPAWARVISAHSGDPQRLAGPLPEIVDGLKFALQDVGPCRGEFDRADDREDLLPQQKLRMSSFFHDS